MIWTALVAAISIAAIDFNSLRRASRHEIAVYATLVVLALGMSALVSWHLWPNIHLIGPFDAMFRPLTNWLYNIL
jgi:hypothetical protein